MAMSFRRYIVIDVIVLVTVNSTFNASYTWWLWRSSGPIHLTGNGGIALDLAATPIWIAVLTTLFGTAAVQTKLWQGRFREPASAIPLLLGSLPSNVFTRATVAGLVAATMLALPLWLLLQQLSWRMIPFEHAVIIKVALTALFTVWIVPLVVLAAIADMQRARA